MQSDSQFHDTQVRTEVAACGRHLLNEEFADLTRKSVELFGRHILQVSGKIEVVEPTHVSSWPLRLRDQCAPLMHVVVATSVWGGTHTATCGGADHPNEDRRGSCELRSLFWRVLPESTRRWREPLNFRERE